MRCLVAEASDASSARGELHLLMTHPVLFSSCLDPAAVETPQTIRARKCLDRRQDTDKAGFRYTPYFPRPFGQIECYFGAAIYRSANDFIQWRPSLWFNHAFAEL
eukprot:scaffold426684_cov28-Prasinocladus_malaysianus.AAC.1